MNACNSLISAVGTALRADDSLHVAAMRRHIADQWDHGMTGILVAGTMGLMQLIPDRTYQDLVVLASDQSAKRGEVMIGVGDTSFARTRDRIRFLNKQDVDGLVILCPYLIKFTQSELISYFTALADFAKRPVYLYELPGLTGTKLEIETVLTLAKHRNIKGIKCSTDFGWTRQLLDLAPDGFRVIAAQGDLIDTLMHHGITEQLDGIFSLCPAWVVAIADAGKANQWERAAIAQRRVSSLLRVLRKYGIFQTFTALLNARGIPGNFAPAPMAQLSVAARATLLAEPIVTDLLSNHPRADSSAKRIGTPVEPKRIESGEETATPALADKRTKVKVLD